MSEYVDKIVRASMLDVKLYEEVEADPQAMGQAMGIVVLSSVAAGIGSLGTTGIKGIIVGILAALVGWFFWAFITYIVGTKLLPESNTRSDVGELLRTIGFSSSPGLIRVLGFIPILGSMVHLAASIWMLVAMVVAVRQALDFTSTWRAIAVCIVGWIIQWVIFWVIFGVFGMFSIVL